MASHTVMLSDSECREVTAALELMIEHCDVMLANGPVHSFSVRRQSAQATLKKLLSDVAVAGLIRTKGESRNAKRASAGQ